MNVFSKVKEYLLQMEYNILQEDQSEELFVVENEDAGIHKLIIDCEAPILIFEYPLFRLNSTNQQTAKELLAKNRDIIHGAFALTDDDTVIFRDTLQLENLDFNEIEATLESLELLLAEYGTRLIEISKMN